VECYNGVNGGFRGCLEEMSKQFPINMNGMKGVYQLSAGFD